MHNNDVISDFQKNLGLDFAYKNIEELQNPSLNHKSILILDEINKRISNKGLIANSLLLETLEIIYSDNSKFKISKEIYDLYQKVFKEDKEWLRKTFFSNKEDLWDNNINIISDTVVLDFNPFDLKFIEYVVRNSKSFLKNK